MKVKTSIIDHLTFNIDGTFEHGDQVGDLNIALSLMKNDESNYEFLLGIDYDVDSHNNATFNFSYRKHFTLDAQNKPLNPADLYPIVEFVFRESINHIGSISTARKITRLPGKPTIDKEKVMANLLIVINSVNNLNNLN